MRVIKSLQRPAVEKQRSPLRLKIKKICRILGESAKIDAEYEEEEENKKKWRDRMRGKWA